MRTGRDLGPAARDRDGVIARHHAAVAAGEDAVEIAWRRAQRRTRFARITGPAAVVTGHELGQVGGRRRQRGVALEAQLGSEAVLERGPQALDATLGLGAGGGDEADREFLDYVAELGGVLAPGQLFLERPVRVVAHQDPTAIAVQRQRHSVPLDQVAQQHDVAVQVLGGTERQGQDLAGGVIHSPEQAVGHPGVREPRERAAVDQYQRPAARRPLPAAVVAGWAPPPLGRQPQPLALAAHAGRADRQPLLAH